MWSKRIKHREVDMKKYLMVAVLGIIVLLLSFAPMPAATIAGQETDEPCWG